MRITVAGGLLGQLDGFAELPGRPEDLQNAGPGVIPREVRGGLDGLSVELGRAKPKPALLLLSGHNLPHGITAQPPGAFVGAFMDGLRRVTAMQPTVVGVSNEDLNRVLRGMEPSRLAEWFAKTGVPFFASNLAVRYSGRGLNVVAGGKAALAVAPDRSVAWLDTVRVTYPCATPPVVPATIEFEEDSPAVGPSQATQCRGELRGRGGFWLPNTRYSISVAAATLTFVTDAAVAPGSNTFPVYMPAPGDVTQPVVLSLLDPATPLVVPGDGSWTCQSPGGAAARCDLTILPPVDFVAPFVDRAMGGPESARLAAAIASMPDAAIADLTSQVPAVRLVVLDPDSGVLGQAWAGGAVALPGGVTQPIGNESRSVAIVNEREPETSALFVRPDWLSETAIHLAINQEQAPPFLRLGATYEKASVRGSSLEWRPGPSGAIAYRIAPLPGGWRTADVTADAAPYGSQFSGGPAGDLWFSHTEFAAAALHVMRLYANADVAAVPLTVGDPDYLDWLSQAYDPASGQPRAVPWASRVLLERVLFHARPYVRVKVKGSDLAGTLNRILALRGGWDIPNCLAGVGNAGCNLATVNADSLRVNGRPVDGEHFYAVAIFRDVADQLRLTYARDAIRDLVDDMHQELLKTSGPGTPGTGSVADLLAARDTGENQKASALSTRLEEAMIGRQSYLDVRPARVDFALNNSTLPDDSAASLLPRAVDGGSPTDSRRLDVSAGVDYAHIDTPAYAVRLVGALDYRDERVQDRHTIDRDQFTLGARYDWKLLLWSRIARVFGGGFLEGGLWTRKQTITPSRVLRDVVDPVNPDVRIPSITYRGDPLDYEVIPRRYISFAGGLEVADVTPGRRFKVRQVDFRVDIGRALNELDGATLNGEPLNGDTLAGAGAAKALEEYYTNTARRQPVASDKFELAYESRWQTRIQATIQTELPLATWNGSDIVFGQELVYRRYHVTAPVAFSFRWSLRERASLTLPIPWRLNVVLGGEYDLARLHAVAGNFRVLRFTAGLQLPVFVKRGRSGLLAR